MSQDTPAKMPESALQTRWNRDFEAAGEMLKPTLKSWIRVPQSLISFQSDPSSHFQLKPVRERSAEGIHSLTWGKDDDFILDFGIHMVGKLSFKLDYEGSAMDAPCRLRFTFGESPFDVTMGMENVKTWISTSWLPDEIINIDVCPITYNLPRRYAFRFLRVEVIDTSKKYRVRFSDVQCECVSAVDPDQRIEKVTYRDQVLQDIDTVSLMTLRECMQTVFEDGPRRDRRVWIGDLRLQGLANYRTFNNLDLMKRCLYLFGAVVRMDGSVPANLFERPHLIPATDYIVDFDALFANIILEYVVASDDIEMGRLLWPTAQNCLKRAISYVDPQTHAFDEKRRKDGWMLLDWGTNLDHSAGLHGVLLCALKATDRLASIIGESPPYTKLIHDMTKGALHFLDQENELFISGPNKQISYASAAWLALSGAFPGDLAARALVNSLAHEAAIKPLTPYMWHYVCEALVEVGCVEQCISIMKSYWGGMLAAGADTFWEIYDPNDAKASPYGDVRNNSFCHAWSCAPVHLLRGKLRQHVGAVSEGEMKIGEIDEMWIRRTQARLGSKTPG